MQQWINDLLINDIKENLKSKFGYDGIELNLISDFENYVFELIKGDVEYILRITHSSHRSFEQVQGELEFIFHLSRNGANVISPVLSQKESLVEKCKAEDGSYFTAISYEKAQGKFLMWNNFTPEYIENWGETTGQLHRLTQDFKPSSDAYKRIEWFEDDLYLGSNYIPENESDIRKKSETHIKNLINLPKDKNSYGLIHTDLHPWNILWNGQRLKVIDFDDASYMYFISDLAIAIYYGTTFPREIIENRNENVNYFFPILMKGYRKQFDLDSKWFDHFHDFIKLRDFALYAVLNQKKDNLAEYQLIRLRDIGDRLKNDIQLFDVDFRKILLKR